MLPPTFGPPYLWAWRPEGRPGGTVSAADRYDYAIPAVNTPRVNLSGQVTETQERRANPVGQPLYIGLADRLREQILDGRLKPGDSLPSELTAAKKHGVSRSVIRQAYQQLEVEGLVLSGQGRG